MKEKIERTTCDQCKETYEYLTETIGGYPRTYLTLFVPQGKSKVMTEKHFCCFTCLWNWVQKNRNA